MKVWTVVRRDPFYVVGRGSFTDERDAEAARDLMAARDPALASRFEVVLSELDAVEETS